MLSASVTTSATKHTGIEKAIKSLDPPDAEELKKQKFCIVSSWTFPQE